jgi:hypothetical protein
MGSALPAGCDTYRDYRPSDADAPVATDAVSKKSTSTQAHEVTDEVTSVPPHEWDFRSE